MLWSCTTCGACVEECPVDIEHIDAIVDMRRYEVLMESRFPSEAGLMLRNVENRGDPWGLGQSKRLEWTEGLDFEVPVVDGDDPGRRRVPLLGGMRRRARRAGPQDDPVDREAAAHGGGELRRPRPRRILHRRSGETPRQRVPLPDAGSTEHRDPVERRRAQDRRLLPALLQLDRRASTPHSGGTSRSSTTPSCSSGCSTRASSRRSGSSRR